MVEHSLLPAKRMLKRLDIQRTKAYRRWNRNQAFGEIGLEHRLPLPGRVRDRIPDDLRECVDPDDDRRAHKRFGTVTPADDSRPAKLNTENDFAA